MLRAFNDGLSFFVLTDVLIGLTSNNLDIWSVVYLSLSVYFSTLSLALLNILYATDKCYS